MKGNLTNLSKKFIKWAKHGIFVFSNDKYSTNLTTNDKSVDGVLVTQTQGIWMLDADESTELWRHPEVVLS